MGEVAGGGELHVGHYLEPFSLELGTASFTLPFMECSPASLLDPARNWGLSLFRSQSDGSTHFALGVFQAGSDANDFEAGPESTIALTGRFTATQVLEEDGEQLLHLGVALSSRFAEQGLIVVNQQPKSPLLNLGDTATSPFVPTISIAADFKQLANLQLAAARGRLWIQAEWYGSWIDQQGGDVVFVHRCYVQCGCLSQGNTGRTTAPAERSVPYGLSGLYFVATVLMTTARQAGVRGNWRLGTPTWTLWTLTRRAAQAESSQAFVCRRPPSA